MTIKSVEISRSNGDEDIFIPDEYEWIDSPIFKHGFVIIKVLNRTAGITTTHMFPIDKIRSMKIEAC